MFFAWKLQMSPADSRKAKYSIIEFVLCLCITCMCHSYIGVATASASHYYSYGYSCMPGIQLALFDAAKAHLNSYMLSTDTYSQTEFFNTLYSFRPNS